MLATKKTNTLTTSIDETMQNALAAFHQFKKVSPEKKASFLEAIADEIEALGDSLITQASEETNLAAARLTTAKDLH